MYGVFQTTKVLISTLWLMLTSPILCYCYNLFYLLHIMLFLLNDFQIVALKRDSIREIYKMSNGIKINL